MPGPQDDKDDESFRLASDEEGGSHAELKDALKKDPPADESDDEIDLTATTKTAKRKAEAVLPNAKPKTTRKVGPNANGPKSGLPYEVQRALALEIESEGGIEWFRSKPPHAVRDLCDKNPGIFGLPGSKRRTKVRNKIKYWRTYSATEYKKLLEHFKSKAPRASNAAMLMQQQAFMQQQALQQMQQFQMPHGGGAAKMPEQMVRMQQQLQNQLTQSSEIFNTRALQVEAAEKNRQEQAARQMQQQQMQPMQVQAARPMQQMQMQTTKPMPAGKGQVVEIKEVGIKAKTVENKRKLPIRDDQKYETIQVDTNRPETHRGIGIFEFNDAEKDGFLHHGYEITMEGDIRDFMADNYKAQLLDGTGILLRIPAVSYSFLHDKEEYEKRAKAANIDVSATEEAHETARKRFLRDPIRQERLVLLEFPKYVELTNKVFSPDSSGGEIDFDLLPVTINVSLNGKDLPMTITRISWKVSTIVKQPRAVKKDVPEEAAQTKGAAKLANFF